MENKLLENLYSELDSLKNEQNIITEKMDVINQQINIERTRKRNERIHKYMENPYYRGSVKNIHGGKEITIRIWGTDIEKVEALCIIIWNSGIELRPIPLFSAKKLNPSFSDDFQEDEWLIDDLENIMKEEFVSSYKDIMDRMESWTEIKN